MVVKAPDLAVQIGSCISCPRASGIGALGGQKESCCMMTEDVQALTIMYWSVAAANFT